MLFFGLFRPKKLIFQVICLFRGKNEVTNFIFWIWVKKCIFYSEFKYKVQKVKIDCYRSSNVVKTDLNLLIFQCVFFIRQFLWEILWNSWKKFFSLKSTNHKVTWCSLIPRIKKYIYEVLKPQSNNVCTRQLFGKIWSFFVLLGVAPPYFGRPSKFMQKYLRAKQHIVNTAF